MPIYLFKDCFVDDIQFSYSWNGSTLCNNTLAQFHDQMKTRFVNWAPQEKGYTTAWRAKELLHWISVQSEGKTWRSIVPPPQPVWIAVLSLSGDMAQTMAISSLVFGFLLGSVKAALPTFSANSTIVWGTPYLEHFSVQYKPLFIFSILW